MFIQNLFYDIIKFSFKQLYHGDMNTNFDPMDFLDRSEKDLVPAAHKVMRGYNNHQKQKEENEPEGEAEEDVYSLDEEASKQENLFNSFLKQTANFVFSMISAYQVFKSIQQ